MQILAGGFMGVILLGGLLLWLPICNTKPIAFMDALFTATSAVCVTGLVTITPAAQFTLAGQIVLIILIQIGGLGIIACVTAFFMILKRQITVKERIVIQETYSMDAPGGMVKMIRGVLKGTFFVEGMGAVLYATQFIPEYGFLKGIWYGVFHSVSAFCNAGIDILGSSSLIPYVQNPVINITTMLLIMLSGIGFIVWADVLTNTKRMCHKEIPVRWWFKRLRLHSKIAIVTTAVLILTGALAFFLLEHNNPATMGNLSPGGKILASFFHSVTTRTAGFATVSQSGLSTGSQLISCILMFIGGSPGGTAGGVKTTTIAMLVLTCITVIKGGRDTECFGRKIAGENIRTGFMVVMLSFTVLLSGTVLVTVMEPGVPLNHILYETTSAIGTVGLSADLTASLTRGSQAVLMMLMYIGRIGPVTLALLFAGKVHPRDAIRELPERRILVG